jgi:DNA-binding Lrp family transcriptional regulator
MAKPHPRNESRERPARREAADSGGSLDFDILREMYRVGGIAFGFDPRESPERIARRLKVGAATVRRRITAWRDRGFFLGYDVLPHPALLGGRFVARTLEFPKLIDQDAAIQSLGLIDGVVQIDSARTTLLAAYFVDSAAQSERRLKQIQATPGVKEIGPELPFDFAACTRKMSRADWRLLQALRRRPEATVAELAASVGQSTRTTSRRYEDLLEENAIMFDPILDYARFSQTLADLAVSVERPELCTEVEQEIRSMHPQSIRSWGLAIPDPAGPGGTVHLSVSAPTTAELDGLSSRVAHLSGVRHVMLWYGRSIIPVRPWLDERIEAVIKSIGPASS